MRLWKGETPSTARRAVAPYLNQRLQIGVNDVDSMSRSEFFELRRWSLGLHRLVPNHTRQGKPGD
jgi:hypothetical protein